jgi:hypothetical protein
MYQVSTVHLTADATRADPAVDVVDRGVLSAGELVLLLERFQELDLPGDHAAGPYIEVLGASGKCRIRTRGKKLFLEDARASAESCAELTPSEIIIQLERNVVTLAPFGVPPLAVAPLGEAAKDPADQPRTRSSFQPVIAAAILAASLLLNGHTVYSVSRIERVNRKPDAILLTDATEISGRRSEIAGTYVTGNQPGDRVITVQPDGRLEFSEVGRKSGTGATSAAYQIGRQGKKICLVTGDDDLILVANIDTLVCYRDTYRRKR